MSVRHLKHLFAPSSIAVIGASNTPQSVGGVAMRNLLSGGFEGPILPVNPRHQSVAGVWAYPDVNHLPMTADLAVVCSPIETVPGLIHDLGERGTRAAIVFSAAAHDDGRGKAMHQAILDASRPYNLRVMGPNCLGLLIPGIGLNASFAHMPAEAGNLAFVSQSGALCTGILDWARANGVGFSHFVSLGDCVDVDFGDVLDYLGGIPEVKGILLYIESVVGARKFMSASRAAARNKTVLVIKAGRAEEGAAAAATHTGALAGSDNVYDAALRRAGMLRVETIDELFDAARTLARLRPCNGDRLAILTNGGGPGVLATDAVVLGGGRLAELSGETVAALDAVLPAAWPRRNPIDIIGDAPPERFEKALEILLGKDEYDALLVMHVPTALSDGEAVARGISPMIGASKRLVLTNWIGGATASRGRAVFREAGIPTYDTPNDAVRAFLHLVHYRRNQTMLMEIPPSIPPDFRPDVDGARGIIEDALGKGRKMLSEPEAKGVLQAYGIPVVETRIAADGENAVAMAEELGYPVAVKILSPDVVHKSDVGGVALDIDSAAGVRAVVERMTSQLLRDLPDAVIEGYTVQRMARRPGARELFAGVTTDAVFGPVIVFGHGGTDVEVVEDTAVALPPLNLNLAADLVSRTRVSKLLHGYRHEPGVDLDGLYLMLTRVSQLIVDLPEVVELDINPLLAFSDGVLALDARMGIEAWTEEGRRRLAIRPYPRDLEEWHTLSNGLRVLFRPIRPEDEPAHQAFFDHLSGTDIYFRFFGLVRHFAHTEMARFTQIDYDREMAFVATAEDALGTPETLGVVRAVSDSENVQAEFAIIVRSDLKGEGLGRALLEKMIGYCRARGLRVLTGQVLEDNYGMLGLAERLGFERAGIPEHGVVEVRLDLTAGGADQKTMTSMRLRSSPPG